MAQTQVKLVLNPRGLPATLAIRWKAQLGALSTQVLMDCNRYARDDTGRLIASSRTASIPAEGKLCWSTPYARRVYYTGTPSHAHNAAASLRWCEKARAIHTRAWAQTAVKLLGGE
ncbi:MAG: minor capsid protein [Eubacteriales bacterium]|nr:minor capsid protein [Eubacteriales bacterium]